MQANSVVLIPFDEDADRAPPLEGMPSSDPAFDAPDGMLLRLRRLENAWQKCHDKIQDILDRLYRATADDISEFILGGSFSSTTLLLPIAQIPTVVIEDQAGGAPLVLERVEEILGEEYQDLDQMEEDGGWPRGLVVRMTARTCANTANAVKTLVRSFSSSFMSEAEDGSTSRANTGDDLQSLRKQYSRYFGTDLKNGPKLVVMFEDFETFDPQVVQDLVDMCSSYTDGLPLRFVVTLSTGTGYVHATVPRSSLNMLRVQTYSLPTSESLCDEILKSLFLDPAFEPNIMLGGKAMEAVRSRAALYASSLSGIVTHLHLLHIYHFYAPISVFAESADDDSEQHNLSLSEELTLYVRAMYAGGLSQPEDKDLAPLPSVYGVLCDGRASKLVDLASDARETFHRTVRSIRAALVVLRLTCDYLKSVGLRLPDETSNFIQLCVLALSGKIRPVAFQIVRQVRQLEYTQVQELLALLHEANESVPQQVRSTLNGLQQSVIAFMKAATPEDTEAPTVFEVEDRLRKYFEEKFVPLESVPLYQAFCMRAGGDNPDSIMDPPARLALIAALTEPNRYLCPDEAEEPSDEPPDLSSFPDASILFVRSLEAGKKINTHDWYESFTLAIEDEQREKEAAPNGVNGESGRDADDDVDLEHQARFIRAMQELQFAGLLKSSNRPLDLVIRTVFDTVD